MMDSAWKEGVGSWKEAEEEGYRFVRWRRWLAAAILGTGVDRRWREIGDKGAVRFLDSDIGVIRGGSLYV